MKINRTGLACLGVACFGAATTGVASAQPFVHNVGELNETSERTRDLTTLDENEIAVISHTGVPTAPGGLAFSPHLVLHDQQGVPFASWFFIEQGFEFQGEPRAIRQDRADRQLIQLVDAPNNNGQISLDTVLFKFDQFAETITWQWRYPMSTDGRVVGMELEGDTGLVAASIDSPAGGPAQPTLLRYFTSTGLPAFHFRYEPVDINVGNIRFIDVASDTENNAVFAVGTVQGLFASNFGPGFEKLVVARFDSSGVPVWFFAYDAPRPNNDESELRGRSIELTPDGVAVTAEVRGFSGPVATLDLLIDPAFGGPLLAVQTEAEGLSLVPADSSLEYLADEGTLLHAGTVEGPQLANVPAMWSLKAPSLTLDWFWAPEGVEGRGYGAVPQPGEGPLLAALASLTPNGPIAGTYLDILLARTEFTGQGLCPRLPELMQFEPPVLTATIPVQPRPLPQPEQPNLRPVKGDPGFDLVCEDSQPCPADITTTGTCNGIPDGVVDLSDFSCYLSLWGAMSPLADVTTTGTSNGIPDGVVDLSDFSFYLALWGTGCP